MQQMAITWIKNQDRTVCLVDWRNFAAMTYYQNVAVKYTKTVGFYLAELIESQNFNPEDVILVGHSLGAHICGFCGNKLNGAINTIYGNFMVLF